MLYLAGFGMLKQATFAFQGSLRVSRIDSSAEDFLRALPLVRDEDFLLGSIEAMSRAEKLDDWKHGSKRVDYYVENSQKALKIFSNGGSFGDLDFTTEEHN